MRVLFPFIAESDITLAGSPFDVIQRNRRDVQSGKLKVSLQPFADFIAVENRSRGVAVYCEGLYEYEHLNGGCLAVTLFRGSGFISRDQTALPQDEIWAVPGNQCLGRSRYRFAVYPYAGDFSSAEVVHWNSRFRVPILVHFQPVDSRKFSGGRPFVQDTDLQTTFYREKKFPEISLPMAAGFLQVAGKDIDLTCMKLAEKAKSMIVRFVNLSQEYAQVELLGCEGFSEIYRSDLNETRKERIPIGEKKALVMRANPKEIVTLDIEISL
jgi:alpha-mannosidase